jgi:hypothetical protein
MDTRQNRPPTQKSTRQLAKNRVSNNVGGALSRTLQRALEEERHFALVENVLIHYTHHGLALGT